MPTPAPVGPARALAASSRHHAPFPAGHLLGRWTPRVNPYDQSGETTETRKTHHLGR
jgi:hypothetical protein